MVDLVGDMNSGPIPESDTSTQPPALPGAGEQWLDATPALRSELMIDLRKQAGRLVAIVEDPIRSRFFQVGHMEYHFLMMLDGKHSVTEIIKAMQHGRGYSNFDNESATRICNWLSSMNLMDTPGANPVDRLYQGAQAKEKQQLIGFLNPVSFKINLLNPNKFLESLLPYTRWIFTKWMLVIWAITGVFAGLLIKADYGRFCDAATGILSSERWLWLLVIWVVLKVVHEIGHGIACKKFGGDVPQAGMLILLFAPMAYVNVTSSWRFSSRKKRMIVSAAGMYIELFLAFLAMIVWAYTESSIVSDICYNIVVMAGISTVLFNANPLLRFDGYYLLADLLGIVNLYGKGQNWFNDRVRNLMFGFPLDHDVCPDPELKIVATYGFCSFLWRVLLSASLLLIASTLLGGAGLLLAAIGGVFWVYMPILQNVRKVQSIAKTHPIQMRRLAVATTGIGLTIISSFFLLSAPSVTRAPAIVRFMDEQVIRSSADGFVKQVCVQDGQAVKKGELLVEIENPELVQELSALKKSAESALIQARIHHQNNELSLKQAELAKHDSLNEQISEMEIKVSQLSVVAPFDGVVFQRQVANMQGRFLKQGDVILHFADPTRKEVVTSIEQEQIETVKAKINWPVRFSFPGVSTVSARINSIEPRATDVPIDPSLTAVAGGTLAVRPADSDKENNPDSGYLLIKPRFTAHCELPTNHSTNLVAGQRGFAFMKGRNVSLGGYSYLICRDWIRRKLKTATQGGL